MAQRSNDKQMARKSKSDRNMNRAVILLIVGLIAEWYLLMADRYYVRGTINQSLAWYSYFGTMRWIGLAVLAAGVVLLAMRKKNVWFSRIGAALAVAGGFFAITSEGVRHVFPTSVTMFCVLVPVLMILGIVYLFYQAEFSVQATALAMALFALSLLSRSGTGRVKTFAVLAILGVVLLSVGTLLLQKNGGVCKTGGKRLLRVFPAKMDYRPTFGVMALCAVAVLAALFARAIAFYAIWVLAVVAFVLAVYYTIKLM